VARFATKYGTPVWMTYGTYVASRLGAPGKVVENTRAFEVMLIDHHAPFAVGALQVLPFPVPHDAREPAQYAFSDGVRKLGVLTDLGSVTAHVRTMLSGCDGLVLECNHDARMLADGPYPQTLKARVGGAFGHLDNDQAAQLLGGLKHDGLRHVFAAHLSRQNNTPALARAALAGALDCAPDWIGVADQEAGFDWRSL
jgi:phosphoribosyl 1,2-cyclic phosphodiesterase